MQQFLIPFEALGFISKRNGANERLLGRQQKMFNFVHIKTFMLKPKQLLDERELVFHEKQHII